MGRNSQRKALAKAKSRFTDGTNPEKAANFSISMIKNPVLNKPYVEEGADELKIYNRNCTAMPQSDDDEIKFIGKINSDPKNAKKSITPADFLYEQGEQEVDNLPRKCPVKFQIPNTLMIDLRLKIMAGELKSKIEDFAVEKYFENTDPRPLDISRFRRYLSQELIPTIRRQGIGNNFEDLEQILCAKFFGKYRYYKITTDENSPESCLGAIILIKNNDSYKKDYFNGVYMVDTKIDMKIINGCKNVVIYQIDKFKFVSIKAIMAIKNYTKEIIAFFLAKFAENSGKIEFLNLDLDQEFIDGVKIYQKDNNIDYMILASGVLEKLNKYLSVYVEINFANMRDSLEKLIAIKAYKPALDYWEHKICKEIKRKITDDDEITFLINSVTKNFEAIWGESTDSMPFSNVFSYEIIKNTKHGSESTNDY